MIKKLTLITILLLGNIAFSQEPKLIEKYLFATLKGKIDDRYDITMNIQIFDVYSLASGMTTEIMGNYHYDRFGKNIYFTKGTINKNSMIIEAEGDEVFTFKLDEATLKNILELKNSSKKITINGTWENKSKKFSCVINSVSPLGGKLSEVFKYNISGEASYGDDNWKATFSYDEDILYSPSINISYFYKTFYTNMYNVSYLYKTFHTGDEYYDYYSIYTNIEKLDIDTLKNTMKENLKYGTSNDGSIGGYFTNDFRIGYFDNKILCIDGYVDEFSGGARNNWWYDYTIISLETGKELSNDFYEDLVGYSEEFKEFWKKEFIEYHEISENEFDNYLYLPKHKQSDDDYYFPAYFIFNNDGTIDIYNHIAPSATRAFSKTKIEMKKLKPYIKKDSFYKYLFN